MKPNRILELDGLRGLAAFAVLMFHYTFRYHELYMFTQEPPFLFRLGYMGVQLFFVVSGFVIFMTIERTETPLDFVVSRFSRLYPTFWAGVIATTLIVFVSKLPGMQRTPFEIAVNLTMLQEFFDVKAVEGVYWTLTRELLFYGLVLGVFAVGLIKHWVLLAYAWLGLQMVSNVMKMEQFGGWFPWKIEFYLLTEYCHLFVAGIVFYQLFQRRASRALYGLLVFSLVNQFLLFDHDLPASRLEESLYVTLFFGVILAIVRGKAKFFAAKPLVFLGSISYALYLVHQYLGYSIIQAFDAKGWSIWAAIILSSLASIAVATAITWCIEKPALRFLRSSYQAWKGVAPALATNVASESDETGLSGVELAENKRIDDPGKLNPRRAAAKAKPKRSVE